MNNIILISRPALFIWRLKLKIKRYNVNKYISTYKKEPSMREPHAQICPIYMNNSKLRTNSGQDMVELFSRLFLMFKILS